MGPVLFANNAFSSLALPIGVLDTSCELTQGTGALFPNPTNGEYFVATICDAATRITFEIVWVTAVSGDTVTMIRAQEGTTAKNWTAGSLFMNLWTAGQAEVMDQMAQPIIITQTVVTFAANSAQTPFLAANPNRKYLWWQNIGYSTLTVAPGNSVSLGQGQPVDPGASGPAGMSTGVISLQAFSGISENGTTLVIWEGV